MSQTINVPNYAKKNIVEKTNLTADAASGQANATVETNQGFAAADHVVIGRLGGESSEYGVLDSVSSTDVLVFNSNLARTHTIYTEVTKLYGDKIRIYRAVNADGTVPDDGDFSLLATVDIDFDEQQSEYTDGGGSSAYWYKATYYNSTTTDETSLADSSAVRGGDYGNYASIEAIRGEAGFLNNRNISDAVIDQKRQAAQELINSALVGRYTLPLSTPINPLVEQMTRLLAAGYLLTQEVGLTPNSIYHRQGMEKIKMVTNEDGTGLLDRIDKGKLSLLDQTKVTSELSTGINVKGHPIDSTATASAANGGGARMFRVSDEY